MGLKELTKIHESFTRYATKDLINQEKFALFIGEFGDNGLNSTLYYQYARQLTRLDEGLDWNCICALLCLMASNNLPIVFTSSNYSRVAMLFRKLLQDFSLLARFDSKSISLRDLEIFLRISGYSSSNASDFLELIVPSSASSESLQGKNPRKEAYMGDFVFMQAKLHSLDRGVEFIMGKYVMETYKNRLAIWREIFIKSDGRVDKAELGRTLAKMQVYVPQDALSCLFAPCECSASMDFSLFLERMSLLVETGFIKMREDPTFSAFCSKCLTPSFYGSQEASKKYEIGKTIVVNDGLPTSHIKNALNALRRSIDVPGSSLSPYNLSLLSADWIFPFRIHRFLFEPSLGFLVQILSPLLFPYSVIQWIRERSYKRTDVMLCYILPSTLILPVIAFLSYLAAFLYILTSIMTLETEIIGFNHPGMITSLLPIIMFFLCAAANGQLAAWSATEDSACRNRYERELRTESEKVTIEGAFGTSALSSALARRGNWFYIDRSLNRNLIGHKNARISKMELLLVTIIALGHVIVLVSEYLLKFQTSWPFIAFRPVPVIYLTIIVSNAIVMFMLIWYFLVGLCDAKVLQYYNAMRFKVMLTTLHREKSLYQDVEHLDVRIADNVKAYNRFYHFMTAPAASGESIFYSSRWITAALLLVSFLSIDFLAQIVNIPALDFFPTPSLVTAYDAIIFVIFLDRCLRWQTTTRKTSNRIKRKLSEILQSVAITCHCTSGNVPHTAELFRVIMDTVGDNDKGVTLLGINVSATAISLIRLYGGGSILLGTGLAVAGLIQSLFSIQLGV